MSVCCPKGRAPVRTICLRAPCRDVQILAVQATAPPQGETHRYQFTVHALDVDHLEVDENARGTMIGFNVHFHTLGSASLTVTYR